MSWFTAWFGYGLGRGAAKAIFGEDRPPQQGIRSMTEEQIRADEKRFAEEARLLDEADRAAKR